MVKYVLIAILALALANIGFSETFRFAVFGDSRPFNNFDAQPKVFKKMVKDIEWIHPAVAVGVDDFVVGYDANGERMKKEYEDFLNVIKLTGPQLYRKFIKKVIEKGERNRIK